MTKQKKIIFIVSVLGAAIVACILISVLMKPAVAPGSVASAGSTVSKAPTSSAAALTSFGGLSVFQETSSAVASSDTSADDALHALRLQSDAENYLHLRYDLKSLSMTVDQLKETLRGYVAEEAFSSIFPNNQLLPSVSAPAASSQAPASQAPAASKAPASSAPPASSQAPAVQYTPMAATAVTSSSSQKYSYITIKRIYTKQLTDGGQNVMAYFDLSISNGIFASPIVSHRMTSFNMTYSNAAGRWIVQDVELDAETAVQVPAFTTSGISQSSNSMPTMEGTD